jgi:hypothetical protein
MSEKSIGRKEKDAASPLLGGLGADLQLEEARFTLKERRFRRQT